MRMEQLLLESQLQYERVKKYFYKESKLEFAIRFSDLDMSDWELIPTPSTDAMIETRGRLRDEGAEFAGFVWHEGRYCFYFVDKYIIKVQFMDNGELNYFDVHAFYEMDLKKVAHELRLLHGS
jgi:hypothetical protein